MIPHETFALPNGLRVVHNYVPESAMVVLCVLYDTGARDEKPELTGIAHLFEHLMFGGSVNVSNFDGELELAGGSNNASTGSDFTQFYDVVPAQNVETAFYLESDRMLGLAFSKKSLDVQRSVVIEEFKQTCLNRPYGRLMHKLLPLLYANHPYRWPVIGIKPEHIAKVTMDEVRQWFYSHYAPNNATLAVVGNITIERLKELTEKWFGPIPRRDVQQRHLADDPWLTQEKRITVYDNVPQTMIAMAYRMDPYGTSQYLAADAITDILAAGSSSRFSRRLVMGTDLFASADASISGSEHSGYLIITAEPTSEDDEAINQAIDLIKAQLAELAEEGNVTEYELLKTKNRFESTFTFDNLGFVNRAQNLAYAEYHHQDINDRVKSYRALTLHDISSTARRLFLTHAPAIVITRPKPN